MTLGERVIAGVGTLALRQFVEFAASVVAAVLLIRHFGPGQFGILSLALAVAELSAVLTGAFDEAARRFIPEFEARGRNADARRVVLLGLTWRAGGGALVALLLMWLAAPLASVFGPGVEIRQAFSSAAPLVISIGLAALATSVFIGLQRYVALAGFSVVNAIISLGVAAAATLMDWSVPVFLRSSAIFHAAPACMLLLYAWRTLGTQTEMRPADTVTWRRYWTYCWPLWGGSALFVVYQQLPRLVLGLFAPVATVGYFAVAKNVIERMASLFYQLPNALLPAFAAQDSGFDADTAIQRVARWALPVSLLMAVGVLCLAPELIMLLAGPAYAPAAVLLGILAVQLLFRLPASVWSTLYYLREQTRVLLWINVARVVPLVTMLFVLIPLYGAEGAAAAEGISYAMALLLFAYHVPRSFRAQGVHILRGIAPALVTFMAGAGIIVLADGATAVRWLVLCLAPLALVAARLIDPQDVDELRQVHLSGRATRYIRSVAADTLDSLFRLMHVRRRPAFEDVQ